MPSSCKAGVQAPARKIVIMENCTYQSSPAESRGWEIVKLLNEKTPKDRQVSSNGSVEARRLLAEYFQLNLPCPSRLHSAILSCAVRMAKAFADFHFVPFLNLWGLENLRPDDSVPLVDGTARRIPSLSERMVKAYAYSLLFHPDEHLEEDAEALLRPTLQRLGFSIQREAGPVDLVTRLLAVGMSQTEVHGRKMTFVQLITPDGEEMSVEVHVLTAFSRMRYSEMEGKMFDALLRLSEKGNVRIEAAVPSREDVSGIFPTAVAYVEHIDSGHQHIHLYDNLSRHLVSRFRTTSLVKGQYVEIVPVIPKRSTFKTAVILRTLPGGAEAFGYREARIVSVNESQGYAVWELLPDASGQVQGITEEGAPEFLPPYTQGYLNKSLCDEKSCPLPRIGAMIAVITFLKRGKDGRKRPYVVDFRQR